MNLVSNLTLAKATAPKPTPSMSLSQSATAPSTPLTPLPQTPSVIIPSSLHAVGPIRKRYSDKCNLAMDQGQFYSTTTFSQKYCSLVFITLDVYLRVIALTPHGLYIFSSLRYVLKGLDCLEYDLQGF